MKKDKQFLDILGLTLRKDYRFPILEIFAFLLAFTTFMFTNLNDVHLASNEAMIFYLISNLMGVSLLIFLILIFKNIAYGLGNDFEKEEFRTMLSHPVKRWKILTAVLLSTLGVALLLFLGVQLVALLIIAPSAILPNINVVLLAYVANCGYALLLTAITLLVTLFIKRGRAAFVLGILAYLGIGMVTWILMFSVSATDSFLPLQIVAVLNPSIAFLAHYGFIQFTSGNIVWTPTITEAASYMIGTYAIIASLFLLSYYYFSRRLSV
jgi:ABC-type transport system involved in multi-copper enzyme maturation permease subunit